MKAIIIAAILSALAWPALADGAVSSFSNGSPICCMPGVSGCPACVEQHDYTVPLDQYGGTVTLFPPTQKPKPLVHIEDWSGFTCPGELVPTIRLLKATSTVDVRCEEWKK